MTTILVGLIGRGIQLSRTPAMHEAAGSALGLRYVYRLLDLDQMSPDLGFEDVLRAAEIAGFSGVNVTYPYKRLALDFLDEVSEAAQAIGSVNTIVLQGGKRQGHNTDYGGFAESFREGLPEVPREHVLLLGAGGAGGAVAQALLDAGTQNLYLLDPDETATEQLAARLRERTTSAAVHVVTEPAATVRTVDGLVNASPVGMAKLPGSPLPDPWLQPHHWVADIVYFPLETPLLKAARRRGCRTLPGSGMALHQAVQSFALFTGQKPDLAVMQATFERFDVPSAS